MRSVTTFQRSDGTTTYRVRFRLAGHQTSETFSNRGQAERFTALLDLLGPQGALDQLYADEQNADVPTLDEYAERHITSLTRVTEGTRVSYRRLYARTWSEPLGPLPLNRITRHDVATVLNSLTMTLSDKSIANAHGLLAGIMNGAVLDKHIATSPCVGVKLPRNTEHERADMRFLDMDEYHALWSAVPEHFQPLIDTLAGTGMRWGEAEALPVRNVNVKAGTVRITQAAKWNVSQSVREFGPPKSKKGRRTVTLPPELTETLARRIHGLDRDDLVFTMPKGGQLRHGTFHGRYWSPAIVASGIAEPRPRLHDLRHSHAAWLLSAGVPIAVLQVRLGHESITTTVNTYGHLLPEAQAAAGAAAGLVFANRPAAIGP